MGILELTLKRLVSLSAEREINNLNNRLSGVRSDAVKNNVFGSSRMALNVKRECNRSLDHIAEIVFSSLKEAADSVGQKFHDDTAAFLKDAFLTEFAAWKDAIQKVQDDNTASYIESVQISTVIDTYLARIEAYASTKYREAVRSRKNTALGFLKWLWSSILKLIRLW